jgi:hypothetical protein
MRIGAIKKKQTGRSREHPVIWKYCWIMQRPKSLNEDKNVIGKRL